MNLVELKEKDSQISSLNKEMLELKDTLESRKPNWSENFMKLITVNFLVSHLC